MLRIPPGLEGHIENMARMAAQMEGHLTDKEVRFLCLLAAMPTTSGEILEIGSFKGKSTIILAKSLAFIGHSRMAAVDPLTLPSETDPSVEDREGLADLFRNNLRNHGVESIVEFHQTFSHDLGRRWNKPLRLLWIDGDHTYTGAKRDFDTFRPYLNAGAIIAFHDTLHGYEGPVRVFLEDILLSEEFGQCGVCGSIAWSQYIGKEELTELEKQSKLRLYTRVHRLIPHVVLGHRMDPWEKKLYKLKRALIPHGPVDPVSWSRQLRYYDNGSLPASRHA